MPSPYLNIWGGKLAQYEPRFVVWVGENVQTLMMTQANLHDLVFTTRVRLNMKSKLLPCVQIKPAMKHQSCFTARSLSKRTLSAHLESSEDVFLLAA
jgi:hypothetical protein